MCLESQGRLATWPFASPEQATVGGSMRRVSLTSLPSLPSLTSLTSLASLTSLTLPNFLLIRPLVLLTQGCKC